MGKRAQRKATFAFYSLNEILLRGTKVVNPSAKVPFLSNTHRLGKKSRIEEQRLSANPMVGGTVSLLLRLQLF
jgi:hypothetical protein